MKITQHPTRGLLLALLTLTGSVACVELLTRRNARQDRKSHAGDAKKDAKRIIQSLGVLLCAFSV
jgi:hypothetical protein